MSVQSTMESDYKQAFKANDRAVVSALRMLKSAIKNQEIKMARDLTDAEVVEIISREVKRRTDAREQYQRAGRQELAAHEQDDIVIYTKYLPAQLSTEDLATIVKETISELKAEGPEALGKVMGAVMAKVKGQTDGTKVQQVVRQQLGIK